MSNTILKKITLPIKLKDASPDVIKAVQSELVRLGYLPDEKEIDGIVGNKTIAAFYKFKIAHHLGDLDTLGATTIAKLQGSRPKLLVSQFQAETVFGRNITLQQLADLNNCLLRFDIVTPSRIRHFMAQVAHESGGLQWMCEIASGRAYEGRKDLGNIYPGDGVKYKGGGCIQLTGRANYQALANYLKDGRVVEEGCSYVATHLPFTSAGFWWMRNGINQMVDKGATCRQVAARVNGKDPANGLQDRERYYAKTCRVIK